MTIELESPTPPVGIWNRLGSAYFGLVSINVPLGEVAITGATPDHESLAPWYISFKDLFTDSLRPIPDGLAASLETHRQACEQAKRAIMAIAESAFVAQVTADVTLTESTALAAWVELIRQMANGNIYAPADSVASNVVAVAVAAQTTPANVGNGAVLATIMRPDGRLNEYVFQEVLDVICSSDGISGTPRQEQFGVFGEPPASSNFAWDWPKGSGADSSATAIDATENNSGGTLLWNGSFSAFTTLNTPDYWGPPVSGVYGTHIKEEGTTTFRAGRKCLKFVGVGSATPSIAQAFNQTPAVAASGTDASLVAQGLYPCGVWLRKSAADPTGTIRLRLVTAAGAPVTDDAGTTQEILVPVSSISNSVWKFFGGWFLMPRTASSSAAFRLEFGVSVALAVGVEVFAADLALGGVPGEVYTVGPRLAVFAGSVDFLVGDKFMVTVSNNLGGALQTYSNQYFNLREAGIQIPSKPEGTETIHDSLVS